MSYEYSNNFDFDREFIKAKNKASFIGQLCQLVGAIMIFFGIIFTIVFIFGEFESNATLLDYQRNSFILALSGLFFISIGSNIGILNTVAIILITALVGIFLVRRQGMSLLFNAQKNMSQGIMPTEEIKGGIFLLISGLLLITPGFFTDCIGFSMFLKPVQNFVARKAKNYFSSRIR